MGSSAAPGRATLSECLNKEQDLDVAETMCDFGVFFPKKSLPWLSNLQQQTVFSEPLPVVKQRFAVGFSSR